MEIQLKQRLVGLTVIFSLAVIFLPMLLDGSGRSPKHLDITIPPAPEIETDIRVEEKVIELKKETASLAQLKPVIVDEISDPPKAEKPRQQTANAGKPEPKPAAVKDAPETVKEQNKEVIKPKKTPPEQPPKEVKKTPPAKVQTKKQVGGDLWVIQTGSFRDKNKAYKERDRIRKSRLSAVFIEKYEQNRNLNYRVRMGPFLTRKKADVVRNKVLAKYNIKGIVMRYEK